MEFPIRTRCIILYSILVIKCISAWNQESTKGSTPPHIAVIGGGIGGTSAAYFLNELFGDDAIIDVYEPGTIGGRLASVPIRGHDYEVGGSIIHPRNKYMWDFTAKFGLEHRQPCTERMGIFNGKEYVYVDSSYEIYNIANFFWRYGWDVYRLYQLTENLLNNFAKIYQLQDEGNAYKDVTSILKAMDPLFVNMTKLSTVAWMKERGFHHLMIDELVMGVTRANYGQSTDVHAFVGAISVAAADSSLWSVLEGNKKVPEELLKSSRASRLHRFVTQVAKTEKNTYMVTSISTEDLIETPSLYEEGDTTNRVTIDENSDDAREHEYDIVIMALPLTKDKSIIKFINLTKQFDVSGHYERIVCTMVEGRLNATNLKMPRAANIDIILTTNPKLVYTSIGRQYTNDNNECDTGNHRIYKIFSPRLLTDQQLNHMFRTRNSTTVVDWLAYPHYKSNQELGQFEISSGLYYVNAIEKAGSAMEMSIIGAKNVALLALKHWKNDETAGMNVRKKEEL